MTDESTQPDDIVEPIEETPEDTGAPPPEMRVEDAIRFSAGLFADLAWINLGLRTNPSTGDTKTDFVQAQLAIDALGALLPLTEGRLDPHDVRDLRNLLSSLQMNFVQRKTAG
ncbi:MAG: DUF1844 domain-containing protein [Armatimonadota bacterium]